MLKSLSARIVGVGLTPLTASSGAGAAARPSAAAAAASASAAGPAPQPPTPVSLMVDALHRALADAGGRLSVSDLDGLIALPALMGGQQFMMGHAVAAAAGLFERGGSAGGRGGGRGVAVRTLDVGGAGPVAALIMAANMVTFQGFSAVAVVAGDTPGSAPLDQFLARADAVCSDAVGSSRPSSGSGSGGVTGGVDGPAVASPVIPNLYDRVARWQMERHGVTREQLAMVASLMTLQATRHPLARGRPARSLEEVLRSRRVAPVTNTLECAKRADGGAALIVASPELARKWGLERGVSVLGGGEAAGPPVPPPQIDDSTYASAAQAAAAAYSQSGLAAGDIDYFSIYDCFPVCFIRGLEAVGVAAPGQGGEYVERMYRAAATAAQPGSSSGSGSSSSGGGGAAGPLAPLPPSTFPINTHGGLLGLGAPWEVPAAHGLAEAVAQLRWEANGSSAGADGTQPGGTVGEVQQGEQRRGSRQVEGARRALVYGNGGVFSASAVVILERCGEEDHGGKMGGGGAASKL